MQASRNWPPTPDQWVFIHVRTRHTFSWSHWPKKKSLLPPLHHVCVVPHVIYCWDGFNLNTDFKIKLAAKKVFEYFHRSSELPSYAQVKISLIFCMRWGHDDNGKREFVLYEKVFNILLSYQSKRRNSWRSITHIQNTQSSKYCVIVIEQIHSHVKMAQDNEANNNWNTKKSHAGNGYVPMQKMSGSKGSISKQMSRAVGKFLIPFFGQQRNPEGKCAGSWCMICSFSPEIMENSSSGQFWQKVGQVVLNRNCVGISQNLFGFPPPEFTSFGTKFSWQTENCETKTPHLQISETPKKHSKTPDLFWNIFLWSHTVPWHLDCADSFPKHSKVLQNSWSVFFAVFPDVHFKVPRKDKMSRKNLPKVLRWTLFCRRLGLRFLVAIRGEFLLLRQPMLPRSSLRKRRKSLRSSPASTTVQLTVLSTRIGSANIHQSLFSSFSWNIGCRGNQIALCALTQASKRTIFLEISVAWDCFFVTGLQAASKKSICSEILCPLAQSSYKAHTSTWQINFCLLRWFCVAFHRLGWDRWILMILIGIAIGILAWVLRNCIEALDQLKWDKTRELVTVWLTFLPFMSSEQSSDARRWHV